MGISRSINLPEEIVRLAEELAAREQVSLEESVSAVLTAHLAGDEYLQQRAGRASEAEFRRALNAVPDVEPDAHDRLR